MVIKTLTTVIHTIKHATVINLIIFTISPFDSLTLFKCNQKKERKKTKP